MWRKVGLAIAAPVVSRPLEWAERRAERATYRIVHALKEHVASLPYETQRRLPFDATRFAYDGYGHSHRACCHAFNGLDSPCGGCGCCFSVMYPRDAWRIALVREFPLLLTSVLHRGKRSPTDDAVPF